MLLFVDFEKAFGTIEWSYVQQTLLSFGFGPSFVYCDIQSSVINNGWSGSFFELGRDVRQGCPLSPYKIVLILYCVAKTLRFSD